MWDFASSRKKIKLNNFVLYMFSNIWASNGICYTYTAFSLLKFIFVWAGILLIGQTENRTYQCFFQQLELSWFDDLSDCRSQKSQTR